MEKNTQELLTSIQTSADYDEYHRKNEKEIKKQYRRPEGAVLDLMRKKGLLKKDVIFYSGIQKNYAYQLLRGEKMMTRDNLIRFCFGCNATLEEAQTVLKITGYAPLYVKNERDSIIAYFLAHKSSIFDLCAEFERRGQPLFREHLNFPEETDGEGD